MELNTNEVKFNLMKNILVMSREDKEFFFDNWEGVVSCCDNSDLIKIATKEDLIKNFNNTFSSIKNSIEKRKQLNKPFDEIKEKIKAYKELIKKEFNILLDRFNDPDKDMSFIIENYDSIPKYNTTTPYSIDQILGYRNEHQEQFFDFFARHIKLEDEDRQWLLANVYMSLDKKQTIKQQEQYLYKILYKIKEFEKNGERFSNLNNLESLIKEKNKPKYIKDKNAVFPSPVKTYVFENEKYDVYIPRTVEDLQFLGQNTIWCFRGEPSENEEHQGEVDYTAKTYLKNPLYIIWKNNKPYVAIDFKTDQAKNINDGEISIEEYQKLINLNRDLFSIDNRITPEQKFMNGITIIKDTNLRNKMIKNIINNGMGIDLLVNKIIIKENENELFLKCIKQIVMGYDTDSMYELLHERIITKEDGDLFYKVAERLLKLIERDGNLDEIEIYSPLLKEKIININDEELFYGFIKKYLTYYTKFGIVNEGIIEEEELQKYLLKTKEFEDEQKEEDKIYGFDENADYGDGLDDDDLEERTFRRSQNKIWYKSAEKLSEPETSEHLSKILDLMENSLKNNDNISYTNICLFTTPIYNASKKRALRPYKIINLIMSVDRLARKFEKEYMLTKTMTPALRELRQTFDENISEIKKRLMSLENEMIFKKRVHEPAPKYSTDKEQEKLISFKIKKSSGSGFTKIAEKNLAEMVEDVSKKMEHLPLAVAENILASMTYHEDTEFDKEIKREILEKTQLWHKHNTDKSKKI